MLHYFLLMLLECLNACEMSVSTCSFVDYNIYPFGLNITESEANATGIY